MSDPCKQSVTVMLLLYDPRMICFIVSTTFVHLGFNLLIRTECPSPLLCGSKHTTHDR